MWRGLRVVKAHGSLVDKVLSYNRVKLVQIGSTSQMAAWLKVVKGGLGRVFTMC
jgi:hypothetical protein